MRLPISALALALLLAPSAQAFADHAVAGNNQKATFSCAEDPSVSITGNQNTITITGKCTSISLAGNQNRITAASSSALLVSGNGNTAAIARVDAIVVPGNENKITYEGALTAKGKTRITKVGNKNTVSKSSPKKP